MQKRTTKALKAGAVLLAFSVSQVYGHAGLLMTDGAHKANAGSAQASGQVQTGRVMTQGNKTITVNGNNARTGETVFPGQQIQTPNGVGATVQLGKLGQVDIAPNTNLALTFDEGRAVVNLVSGCVILTAREGVAGLVETAGGSERTEPATGGSIDICTATTPGAPPVVGQGAAAAAGAGSSSVSVAGIPAAATVASSPGGLFGLGTAGTLGFIGSAAMMVTAAAAPIDTPCRRGPNPSPGEPRGRNDECR